MKHLHTFTQHLNESNESQSDRYKVTKSEFVNSVMDTVPLRSEPFTPDDMKLLDSICSLLLGPDTKSRKKMIEYKPDSSYDARFKINLYGLHNEWKTIWIGKNTNNTWSLSTSDRDSNPNDYSHYIFPSQAELILFMLDFEWAKIK